MAVVEKTWCLICEQRPVEGVIRRVYVDTGTYVVTAPNAPLPRICQTCANRHHNRMAKPDGDRSTIWEFEMADGAQTQRQ